MAAVSQSPAGAALESISDGTIPATKGLTGVADEVTPVRERKELSGAERC